MQETVPACTHTRDGLNLTPTAFVTQKETGRCMLLHLCHKILKKKKKTILSYIFKMKKKTKIQFCYIKILAGALKTAFLSSYLCDYDTSQPDTAQWWDINAIRLHNTTSDYLQWL